FFFFFSSRRRHTRSDRDWSSDVCSSDLTMPGDGEGKVREILTDLIASGYSGAISIEPHVAVVFHDATVKTSDEEMFNSFVEYGRSEERRVGKECRCGWWASRLRRSDSMR